MTREAPAWLADLQARFGAAIRTPLDRASGTLTVTPAAYETTLVADSDAERLAVYNRQYWFRLLDLMHAAFPLTSALLGAWAFNEHSAAFFAATPPRGWDLDDASTGFVEFFAKAIGHDELLVQSARIDAAWSHVFRAPRGSAFQPSAADAARLLDARLVPTPALAVVEESAALFALRKHVLEHPTDTRVPLPARLPQPRWWALVGRDAGVQLVALEPTEATLVNLLLELPVRDALARLETACAPDERAALPAKTQPWLARSVQHGFWTGLRFDERSVHRSEPLQQRDHQRHRDQDAAEPEPQPEPTSGE